MHVGYDRHTCIHNDLYKCKYLKGDTWIRWVDIKILFRFAGTTTNRRDLSFSVGYYITSLQKKITLLNKRAATISQRLLLKPMAQNYIQQCEENITKSNVHTTWVITLFYVGFVMSTILNSSHMYDCWMQCSD